MKYNCKGCQGEFENERHYDAMDGYCLTCTINGTSNKLSPESERETERRSEIAWNSESGSILTAVALTVFGIVIVACAYAVIYIGQAGIDRVLEVLASI